MDSPYLFCFASLPSHTATPGKKFPQKTLRAGPLPPSLMAAHEGGGNGARRPPAPPLLPTLSLPPRSAAGSLFSAESSPGALTLAASLFPDAPSPAFQGSFTQLLVGAMGYPAASAPAPPSPFPVPHGLSPTAFLGGSPGLFSPTVTYSPQANQQS